MIARVTFDLDGEPVVATLGDDRRWTVAGWPPLEGVLNSLYSPQGRDGPAYGEPGHAQAHEVADYYGGAVECPERTPAPPGVDY